MMINFPAASAFAQPLTEMAALQMLDAIDSKRVEGIFCGDLSHVPEGQARAMQLLDDSYGACLIRKDSCALQQNPAPCVCKPPAEVCCSSHMFTR